MRRPWATFSLLLTLASLPCVLNAAPATFNNKTVFFDDGDFPSLSLSADFNNDGREDFVSTTYTRQPSGAGQFSLRLCQRRRHLRPARGL